MLDEETRQYLGIGVEEFARRYNAGEYDDPDDDPIVMRLGFHLEFLQQDDTPVSRSGQDPEALVPCGGGGAVVASEPEDLNVEYREITSAEAWILLDADTRRYLGIGAEEFARRYHAGEYDDPDDDPFIMRLAMELEFLERNAAATP